MLGGKCFVIVIDVFMRFVDAKAVRDQSAQGFATYLTEYTGRYGMPEILISDNSKAFDCSLTKELTAVLNTDLLHHIVREVIQLSSARCKQFRKS